MEADTEPRTFEWTTVLRIKKIGRYRDYQKSKVYRWDAAMNHATWQGEATLTLEECQTLVNKACWAFGISKILPRVVDSGRMKQRATADQTEIRLPEWARTPAVVLHEVTHSILSHSPYSWVGHGPAFATVFAQLMWRFTSLDLSEITASASWEGVEFTRPTQPWLMINPETVRA